jgi:WD40 repeat protein
MPTLSLAGTFVATGNMTHPREDDTATLLPDGRVLIAGGYDLVDGPDAFHYLASAELYDPSTHKFTRTGSMDIPRSGAAATLLADGRVLIVGGEGCKDPARCTERDWTNGDWPGSVGLKSAELYDPTTGRFTLTGSMSEPSDSPSATLLPDGRVLVVDGGDNVVEAYNPTTGKFARVGTLSHPNGGAVALLPSGKVFVFENNLPGPGAEVFDPSTGLSSSIRSVALGDESQDQAATAISLEDGRVLAWVVAFNANVSYLYTYDPATNALTEEGSIDAPAGWVPSGAVLLRDGRVLFAGGSVDSAGVITGTDLAGVYDPATGFHLLDSKMATTPDGQTMTTLADGTVLIAGGDNGDILNSAEIFEP